MELVHCKICELGQFSMRSLSTHHYCDVIMGTVASQITSLMIVYTTVYSDADQSKHQSSASLAFVWGIHRGPVNSPHKWPVTRKMFSFDDVIMLPRHGSPRTSLQHPCKWKLPSLSGKRLSNVLPLINQKSIADSSSSLGGTFPIRWSIWEIGHVIWKKSHGFPSCLANISGRWF